ncbi:MAG: type II secretion system secretin GspD [Nitrospirae bacterium]|nr:type II secretion system secretin GspD [Nitrospirota bacterium]MCL5422313.1 type II secretion system secretin GspD [Nitrospirota bacterium]
MRNLRTVFAGIALLLSVLIVSSAFPETKKAEKVTFNFVDVDLPTITKFISDITKKNFIFDERVKGKITIIAPSKLSIDEAYNLFTSVLELKGFTVVPSGVDAYKIIPSSEAKQRGIAISRDKQPVNESYIARLITLKNISSEDALKFIQPMVSKDGFASAFGPGNLLLVIDSGLNLEKILSIVDSIDQPSMREGPEIVFLKHSSADTVAKMLNEGMSRRLRGTPQPVAVDETRAVADQRLNAVVLFGDKGARESMKSLISLVDTPSPEALARVNVYFLENADATDLLKVLEGFIKGSKPQQAAQGAAPVAPFEAAGGISITADKSSNALIIVASPSDYQSLVQVIKQLDRRRRQVYVEAMIVEATIDRLRELGAKWRLTARKNGEPVAIGGFGTMDSAALNTILTGLEGVTLGGMGNFLSVPIITTGSDGSVSNQNLTIPGFAALFSLNEFRDVVNVLSTPQILTSDNKEAEIVVGENVPFISKRERDLTTTNTVLNSIERMDVGIKLKITPQITEGDYVKLDIYQEISSLVKQSETITINLGPTITKRSTKTAVVVKDNQIVVIGGLMQETDEENITKIPLLGDIPVLGYLFKNTSVSKKKTNLLVFLNPHIIKESERLAQITSSKQKEFGVVENRFLEGELLVKFKEGVNDDTAREIIARKGATVIRYVEGIKVYHIRLPKGLAVEDAVKDFSSLPEVQYAEPNYGIKLKKID